MGDEDVAGSIIELVAGKSLTHRVVMRDDFLSCIWQCHTYVGWTHEGKQVNADTLAILLDHEAIDTGIEGLGDMQPRRAEQTRAKRKLLGRIVIAGNGKDLDAVLAKTQEKTLAGLECFPRGNGTIENVARDEDASDVLLAGQSPRAGR